MLLSWLTYLRVNHAELYQQYLSEMDTIDKSLSKTRCVESLACMQRWAARVKEMLEPQRATG